MHRCSTRVIEEVHYTCNISHVLHLYYPTRSMQNYKNYQAFIPIVYYQYDFQTNLKCMFKLSRDNVKQIIYICKKFPTVYVLISASDRDQIRHPGGEQLLCALFLHLALTGNAALVCVSSTWI